MKCFATLGSIILILFIIHRGSCSPKINTQCVCGEGNIINQGRIVNGHPTTANKYPWMAAMFADKGSFICGGSVISDKNILSAGHCVFYMQNPLLSTWTLGMHSLQVKNGEFFKTKSFELHPKFKNDTFYDDFDMSIITLDRSIKFNHNILPICMPTVKEEYFGEKVIVAGWGRLGESRYSKLAKVLMETKVWLKTDQQCKGLTRSLIKYNPNSMLCAHEKNTDACQGDSGGPLFIEKDANRFVIIGTVSFGDGCARAFPGIYGRVATAETLNWINDVIQHSDAAICSDRPRSKKRSMFSPRI